MLHTAAYRALGLAGWSYQAIECTEVALPGLLASIGSGWAGLSLTMPLKRAVLPLLDRVEQLAADVGGANTVIFENAGTYGCNTDVPGMITAIEQAGQIGAGTGPGGRPPWNPPVRRPLVLGGGATACAALAALRSLGAGQVAVAVRDEARAGPLLAVAERLESDVLIIPFDGVREPTDWDLLVSTVPALAADGYAARLAAGEMRAAAVLDVVYHPWPTRLAAAAQGAGSTVISGFELLLYQAARQVELMTGLAAPVAAMRAAGQAELDRRAGGGS